MILSRRNFLGGLIAAPAIVHIENIMPVKLFKAPLRRLIVFGDLESGVVVSRQFLHDLPEIVSHPIFCGRPEDLCPIQFSGLKVIR